MCGQFSDINRRIKSFCHLCINCKSGSDRVYIYARENRYRWGQLVCGGSNCSWNIKVNSSILNMDVIVFSVIMVWQTDGGIKTNDNLGQFS